MDEVVAVVTDLFFQSRIAAAARAAGRQVRFVASESAIDGTHGNLALVDLDAAADVLAMIRALKAQGLDSVVAFGPHVDTEARKAARSAGADRVLAKSKFVTELPRLMQDGFGAAPLE
jgi:CheY-like chemotaxis protein